MNDNYNYTEYNEEKNRIPWTRVLIIVLMLVVTVVIALFVLKGCGKKDLNQSLLEAGKDYYEKYPSSLPTEEGECFNVTLKDLTNENLIKNTNEYQTCDDENTYVKVCLLPSKSYHYTAVLSCGDEDGEYGMWTDGEEDDLITDKSDIRFKFKGEELNLGIKYYYPNNLTELEKVKEYYASAPNEEYKGQEDAQTGYKWYTEGSSNVYWNKGSYSSTQPSGFTNKGESTTKTYYSETQPTSASYRTINENITLYRQRTVAKPVKYMCWDGVNGNVVIESPTPCQGQLDEAFMIYYSCEGNDSFVYKPGQAETECSGYTDWSTKQCSSSQTTGIRCESKTGFSYTDTMWKWYKTQSLKKYYPSGSATSAGENTYYLSAPTSNAKMDDSTKATVYKFYKVEKDETADATNKEWVDVTNGFVLENELLETFKKLGYDVNNLSDINKLENIRYQTQLQYRNLEK